MRGSCLCGGVQYEVNGPLLKMAHCHCSQCRKASGADYATNATVKASGFRITEGEALLKQWESSPGQARVFCGRCGSPIMKRAASGPEWVRLRLGCLDSEVDERPMAHVFVSEKACWTEIPEGALAYEGAPPAT